MKEVNINEVRNLSRSDVKRLVKTLKAICPEGEEVVDLKVNFYNKDITVGNTMYYWE